MDFGNNLDEMFKGMGKNWENYEGRPNAQAQKFYRRVEEGKQPLFPGCTNFSRLGFMIRLYYLKFVHRISDSAFEELLKLMKEVFSEAHLPLSFNVAKNVIKDLGLHYEKIHACPNSCMLYWAENKDKDECHTCGVSRWVVQEKKGSGVNNKPEKLIHKVPTNVMRYFPLKPRLQRMFMCKEFSKIMTWHAVGRNKDGKLRHLADGEAWKMMDAKYPDFSSKHRNVNLGVAADGFCPYRTMNLTHSTWPIVLVNYNLPPWLGMKQENLILSTLISGPDSPGNNIDVYMQLLITELKELWDIGIETYDALTDQNFKLRACVIWTISSFLGYAMLSGWSTKGKLACSSPFELAFKEVATGSLLLVDLVVDAFFAIDIILTFFVAYLDKSTYLLVDDHKQIAYVTHLWFPMDLASTLPFQTIYRIFEGEMHRGEVFGFLNLLRLWRLRRVSELFSRDSINEILRYASKNRLLEGLKEQMLAHMQLKFKTAELQHEEVLEDLPKAIRSSIAQHLFHKTIENTYLFEDVSEIKAEYFPPKVEIILQNEIPTDFYVIVSGAVKEFPG
ncbi:hypothetical protein AgCh_028262 [Apium graveolens]